MLSSLFCILGRFLGIKKVMKMWFTELKSMDRKKSTVGTQHSNAWARRVHSGSRECHWDMRKDSL